MRKTTPALRVPWCAFTQINQSNGSNSDAFTKRATHIKVPDDDLQTRICCICEL
jgi:hypothetical protein